MVYTAIADIINPEVLADQIGAKFPDFLVFGQSSLVEVDTTFPLGSPGTVFKMPFYKRIGSMSDMSEGVALVPGKITTGSEHATVVRGGIAEQVLDTAQLVAKSDAMGEISTQLGRRTAEYIDNKLILEVQKSTNRHFIQDGSGTGTWDEDTAINAVINTLGDNFTKILQGGAIIMHSKVYKDLVTQDAIKQNYVSDMGVLKSGIVSTISGLPILLSDRVTVGTESSKAIYKSYIVGPGALALFYQRQVVVEYDRDILLQSDVIVSTVHFAPHLFGYDDVTAGIVAEDAKSVHAVIVTSN